MITMAAPVNNSGDIASQPTPGTDRKSNPPSWQYPMIRSAMITGYEAGAAPGAMYAQFP